MAQLYAKDPRNAGLFIGGQRLSGAEIRDQNVLAAQTIANIVKSSLGPSGWTSEWGRIRGRIYHRCPTTMAHTLSCSSEWKGCWWMTLGT